MSDDLTTPLRDLLQHIAEHHREVSVALSGVHGPNPMAPIPLTPTMVDEMLRQAPLPLATGWLVQIICGSLREVFEPPGLRDLIGSMTYKPGWEMSLGAFIEDGEQRGWAFYVVSDTENSYDPTKRIRVRHEFLVPPASWNRDTWAAWLRDRVAQVEEHELGEFLTFDGVREFAPHHGNGEDPYRVWHVSDYAETRTRAGETTPDAIARMIESRREDPEFRERIRKSIEDNREVLDAIERSGD